MSKRDFSSMPSGFSVCVNEDCSQASTCLHQLYFKEMASDRLQLSIVNPLRCSKTGGCQFYRDCKPVTYARGFTNFEKKMYPGQYFEFKSILIGRFGRNPFYERRRGDFALPPTEQKIILNALRQSGVTEDFKFDSYEERINWYD